MIPNTPLISVTAHGIGSFFKSIGEGASTISNFFKNIGTACVNVINAGLSAFSKLVYSAINILTADPESEVFSDFWDVINRVSSILGVIATTVMVLLFIINIATDAWDTRHEMELWSIVKMIVKMIVAVVIVNNAIRIVVAIFKVGAIVASGISTSDMATTIRLNDNYAMMIESGVSGVQGFMMLIVFLLAAIVIIACAIGICVEIYQRVFKMYILIPFSTISFTTFVMGDGNRGNEVFHGYLKTILSTAAEAVIIVLCISFTHSLISSSKTMNELFPALSDGEGIETIECTAKNDAQLLAYWEITGGTVDSALRAADDENLEFSEEVIEFIRSQYEYKTSVSGGQHWKSVREPAMVTFGDIHITSIWSMNEIEGYTGTAYIYPKISWADAFMIILQVIFPCVLCAGAVKAVSNYSGMILGR